MEYLWKSIRFGLKHMLQICRGYQCSCMAGLPALWGAALYGPCFLRSGRICMLLLPFCYPYMMSAKSARNFRANAFCGLSRTVLPERPQTMRGPVLLRHMPAFHRKLLIIFGNKRGFCQSRTPCGAPSWAHITANGPRQNRIITDRFHHLAWPHPHQSTGCGKS